MAQLKEIGEYAGPGEQSAAKLLAKNLPSNYLVLTNLELRLPSQVSREVDFLIIGDHAIYLADEKSLSGTIEVTQNRWILSNGDTRHNPMITLNALARHLKGLLERTDPRFRNIRVQSTVLMSNPFHFISMPAEQARHVVPLGNAADYFTDKARLDFSSPIPSNAASLIESLLNVHLRPRKKRTAIGSYQVTERIDQGLGYVTYLARTNPKDEANYFIKVFDLTTVPREEREDRLGRERALVRKIEDLGISARPMPPFLWNDDSELVFAVELPPGSTLRTLMARTGWTNFEERKMYFMKIANALHRLHDAGIIHRNLRPESVYIAETSHDPDVRITDFDLARGADISTVGPIEPDELASLFLPPELRLSLTPATIRSDVYSLAVIGKELLLGEAPEGPGVRISSLPGTDELDAIIELLDRAADEDPENRPESVSNMLQQLRDNGVEWAVLHEHPNRSHHPAQRNTEFQIGAIIDNRYELHSLLGSGGSARTYKVFDRVSSSYKVIKVIKNSELAEQLSLNEFRQLEELSHGNIVRIYHIQPASHPWHLLMEFVPGLTLLELRKHGLVDAETGLLFGKQLLDAIGYMEQKQCYHRDLSPRNVMATPNGTIKIIDFGLSEGPSESAQAQGTYLYRPPENDKPGNTWGPTGDLYAIAVMLCELLSGEYPFNTVSHSNAVDKSSASIWIERNKQKSIGPLTEALAKALSFDPADRYQNAREFANALELAGTRLIKENSNQVFEVNPWVDKLLKSFRQGRFGNVENRGRESDFTRETYIPTRLDMNLVERIITKDFCLVLLSGNPGDGKTAFLQSLADLLQTKYAGECIETNPNGWTFRVSEHIFHANYDASESYEEQSSDEVLRSFFHASEGTSAPSADFDKTKLIAINDGRLYEFFKKSEAELPWLSNQILRAQDTGVFDDSRILLVDLNDRSLVGAFDSDTRSSLVDQLLDSFLLDEHWDVCNQCLAKSECPIKYNVDTLKDPQNGVVVRKRLVDLFRILHMRGNDHMTMRDLRSSLSYVLTGVYQCKEIHSMVQQGKSFDSLLPLTLSESAFNNEGRADDVLKALGSLDPASVTNPGLDRRIFFSSRRSAELESILLPFSQRTRTWRDRTLHLASEADTAIEQQRIHAILRRAAYFELDDSGPQGIVVPQSLLPFRYFEDFCELVRSGPGQFLEDSITKRICRAITRSEGIVDPDVLKNGLCIRTESGSSDLIVFKKFEFGQFASHVGRIRTNPAFCEILPTFIDLQYEDAHASFSLRISLDMYEFLMRLEEGYVPVPGQAGGFAVDLKQFKNLLLRVQTSQLLIFEDGRQIHPVHQDDNHRICLTSLGS